MIVDEVGDICHEFCLVDVIRNLGYDDFLVVVDLFDFGFGAYDYSAATGFVGVADALIAINRASGRKVGSRDIMHKLVNRKLGIFEKRDRCIDGLCQIMGRHICCHTNRDTA